MAKTSPKKHMRRPSRIRIISIVVTLGLFILIVPLMLIHFFSQSSAVAVTPMLIPVHPSAAVCGAPIKGKTRCHARVVMQSSGSSPFATSSPSFGSFGPTQFHTAYALPCMPNGIPQAICPTPIVFGPQTIAIVDAYNASTIENDLSVYSSYYSLPQCTSANGCLRIVNQQGGTSLPTTVNSGWALETSLDVEVAHAICQTCKILLIEANSNGYSDLATAVNTAAGISGVVSVSNSYGGSEWSGETAYDSYYTHPGVAVTASAGDSGYGSSYPAASTGVVAVGGTTLQIYSDNTYLSESVWSGTGSGCSSVEKAPIWQTNLSNWSQTGCASFRAISDVAADADPNTGAAVYDSTPYSGQTGWYQVGGTSLASPIIASVFALTGSVPTTTAASSIPYANFTATNSHDIVSGSNGTCSTIMCMSTAGYDGPTGLGTPNGIGGFSAQPAASPTATPTPGQTTPTPTPTPVSTDTTPPTVSITSPLPGSTIKRNSIITISATASDNVGVVKVQFFVGSTLLCTNTTSPHSCVWSVPGRRNATYTLTATAYDAAGNHASSVETVKAQ